MYGESHKIDRGKRTPWSLQSRSRSRGREKKRRKGITRTMDSSSIDTARFQKLLEQEKQRAMVNQMVAKLTDLCWDKCITGSLGSSISSSETTCLTNCAQRFMDLSMITMQRFKSMR